MGSGQSSSDKSGSFSIDPSGKISQSKKQQAQKASGDKKAEDLRYTNQTDQEPQEARGSLVGGGETMSGHEHETSRSSTQQQLSTLNNMPRNRSDSDQLRLQELDEILTRMKTKYKPNSVELAGKTKGLFEDIEKKLMHCYKVNKEQPLKCADLTHEYHEGVSHKRAELFGKFLNTS